MADKPEQKFELRLVVDDKGTAKLVKFGEISERQFKRAKTSASGLTKTLTSMTGVLGGLALAAGAVSLAHFIKENLEAADAIGKTADKIGVTTDQLQELRFAAEQNGVAVGTLDMALQRFSRRLGEVAQGQGELLKTAQQYNVKLTDSEGRMRSNMELMADWADVIKNAASEQEALRIAFKLFDSEGAAMVNLLRGGADEMNRLRQEARDLGIVLDESLIRGAERANDQVNKLSRVIEAQFMGAIAEMAPEIAQLGETITEAFRGESAVEFGQAIVTVAQGAVTGIKAVATAIITLNELALRIRTLWDPEAEALFQAQQWVLANSHLKQAEETLTGLNGTINKTRKSLKGLSPEAKKAAEELKKAMDRLYEQILQHDETTLETQLRHLDKLADAWAKNADMIVLIEHRKYQLISQMARDLASEVERLFEEERAKAEKLGQAEIDIRDKTGREKVKINKSSLQEMLEDWADMSKGWEQIAKNFLENLQSEFASTIKDVFEGAEDAWDGLWESFKNIAYQAIAAVATKLASGLVANIVLNIFPSAAGALGIQDGGAGSIFGAGSDLLGWLFGGGGGAGGAGAHSIMDPAMGGFVTPGTGAAYGFGAYAGAAGLGYLGGSMLAPFMWGDGENVSMGGGLGGAAGAMIGLALGGPVGAIIGGLLGSAAGGGIGDLFSNDDSADREADAAHFRELAEKIVNRDGTQKDYIEAIKSAHRSDNRVGGPAMEQLHAAAKAQGLLDWWAPTPGQLGAEHRREYTDEQWKRFQIYGGAEEGETGAMDFAQLFGGGGKGAWGGADWSQVQDVMEGLSEETIDKLGSSLGTIKDLATEWGLSVADLLGPLNDADLNSDEWKEALDNLSAATLVQNAADAERAKGLDELTIASNAVSRSIKMLAGWNDMDDEQRREMILGLQKHAGKRKEMMEAAERLREIEEKLTNAHELSEEEIAALADEYAALTEKLGLNDTAAADAAKAAQDFADVMRDEVIPALRDALGLSPDGPPPPDKHTGGWLGRAHTGSWLGAALSNGLISESGGSLQRAHSGLWMGRKEVPFIGLEEERVLSHAEVRNMGGQAMVDLMASGMLRTRPASQQPRGGDSGQPVQFINHIHAAPGMNEQDLAREVARQTMAQLRREFPQLVTNNREHVQRVVEQTMRVVK
jgi:hypothetical protein